MTVPERLQALDTDVDNIEAAIQIAQEVAIEHKAAMRRLTMYAASILATLATSTIMLALNLLVK